MSPPLKLLLLYIKGEKKRVGGGGGGGVEFEPAQPKGYDLKLLSMANINAFFQA
jgi:hypothetical protein